MNNSYKINRFGGNVGQVGGIQPQSFSQKAFARFMTMLVMVMLLGTSAAWAQGRTVTGKVSDPSGHHCQG